VIDFLSSLPDAGLTILLNGTPVAITASSGAVGSFSFQIPGTLLSVSPTIAIENTGYSSFLTPSEVVSSSIYLGPIYVLTNGELPPPAP